MSRPPPNGSLPNGGYRKMSNGSTPSLSSTAPANLSANTPLALQPGGMISHARIASMSRAERFEDEKRRIIQSCFSKYDQSGQLSESYITHIRVQEDGLYPSAPPPPDSAPDNKKPRIVIIAVRSTGRVRMHKARENNNGSFSIGKTWNLEDLTAIESFANGPVFGESQQQIHARAAAGATGFTVTITKPYYWQAGTAKEKEFFIASTVKIFRKYTKGQLPDLRGFDETQKAAMLGPMPGVPQQPPPQPDPPRPLGPREMSEPPAPPNPPFAQGSQSRDTSRYRGSPGPPGSIGSGRDYRSGSTSSARNPSESPARSAWPPPPMPTGPVPKPFASAEQLRSGSPAGQQPDSRPGTSPNPSPALPRSPPPPVSEMPRPPSDYWAQSKPRPKSPANTAMSSRREPAPQPQPFTPQYAPRKGSYGQSSIDSIPPDSQMPRSPPLNGTAAGSNLFHATQRRWSEQRDRGLSDAQTPQTQLPPIETSPPSSRSITQPRTPNTGVSEASSGFGGDVAGFAAATGFAGAPDHFIASPPPPVNEPSSPPTPPRSKRRPTLESSFSDPTVETRSDMKPAPLAQRSITPVESTYVTPREGPTPTHEDLPVIKPLSPSKNKSESSLPLPGLNERLAPSPLSTPAEPSGDKAIEEGAEDAEDYRPGLGPMIRKKAVADRMKKAALAASAFKPRPGGAAEKILKAKAEREGYSEPDGITGVVPAPKREIDGLAVKEPTAATTPTVEVSSPISPAATNGQEAIRSMDGTQGVQLQDEQPGLKTSDQQSRDVESSERAEQRQVRQPQVKVKRRSVYQERYLDELGVDRSLLVDKCLDFEMTLHDFGWDRAALSPKALADMEASLRREQSRLDAGSWLSTPGQETSARQDRETQVLSLLDKAIQECDEMDGLLTIYNVELSSLNDDVAYIEAQSQGLQVQASNQRNLQSELTNLVTMLSLDKRTLEPLRHADLSNLHGLDDAEQCLKKLYAAMMTIDPTIRSTSTQRPKSGSGLNEGHELSSMAAVRQKRDVYVNQSEAFCQRLMGQLDSTFASSFSKARSEALVPATGPSGGMKLNLDAYTTARKGLWVYSPLVLFTKELNMPAWATMLRMYHQRAKPLYADGFGQNVASWKRAGRKVTGDEGEVLFTAQERDEAAGGSVVSSARKLTVKRSQTLAKTLRHASGGDKPSPSDSRSSGGMHFGEVFSGAMDEMAPLISQEQNFVVDLFHATSLETADFMDVISATPPDRRRGTNLMERKPTEPDREMARTVTSTMNEIFSFFTNEMASLLDWAVSVDPIQGVGVMASLSRHTYYLQDTSQEFLIQLTDTLMARLLNLFAKFVDEQIRAIEETKVKTKKRKGVIGFVRIFPHFAAAVENTFAAVGGHDYDSDADCMAEARLRVDEAYARINRAMFDSLKVIAKESPTTLPQGPKSATEDPDDKEKMNYHVLIIENMNHYIEEVDDGGKKGVLAEWKGRAETERAEALESYVGQVLRRPLGKLLDFLDSIDSIRETHPNNPSTITSRPSFSRKAARNCLSPYDGKEIRRGIDQLRGRIEKHFGHSDDEVISRALVALVCKECEKGYEATIARTEAVIRELYPSVEGEKPVELDFAMADVQAGFKK